MKTPAQTETPAHAGKTTRPARASKQTPASKRATEAPGVVPPALAPRQPLFGLAQRIQAKLEVSQPGDADEHEADRVAEQVVQAGTPQVQRCACGGEIGSDGECAACKARRAPAQNSGQPPTGAPASVGAALRSPSQPLSAQVRSYMEPRFGADFGNVRVHTSEAAAHSARDINALAYTVGNQIVFAPGQFQPETQAGRRLLAHELTHVVQQGATTTRSNVIVQRADSRIQRAMGTLCYSPGQAFFMNPLLASAFGIIAHKLIALDYLSRMSASPADVYFDDSFAGPIDPRYGSFIISKNPGMGSFARGFIRTQLKRPDMLIHDATRREYDEVKPDSVSGILSGISDNTIIDFYMDLIALPYVYGTSYTPSPSIPIGATSVGGVPVEFSLRVRRYRSGLIVYQLCIRTDWLKVTLFAAIMALIALLIALFPEAAPVLIPALAANEPEQAPNLEGGTAVAQAASEAAAPLVQAKSAISQPGDADEREAEQVAEQVTQASQPVVVQRKAEAPAGRAAPPSVGAALAAPGQPLSMAARSYMEPRFGADFGNVRVHTGEAATRSAREIGALAYTIGNQIVFAPNQFQPATASGKQLLAHELTHVLQQSRRGSSQSVLQRDPDPAGPTPAPAPVGAVPDETTPNRAINMDEARARNPFWWGRLELADLHLIRDYNPTDHPIAYANRTLELQRLLRTRGLDRRTIGERLDPDGILGPRTFLALRLIAANSTTYAADIPAIQGAGFDISVFESGPQEAQSSTFNALADIRQPTFVAQWPTSTSSEAVLRFYRSNFNMIEQDREVLDTVLFPEGAPANITRDDRLDILSRVYSGQTFTGTAALVTVRRPFLHAFDAVRTGERDRRPRPQTAYFKFLGTDPEYVGDMTTTLRLQLPQTQRARQVREQIDTQQTLSFERATAGLIALYYLPVIDETRRAEAVTATLAAHAAREQAIQENNRTAARQRSDRLIGLMDGPHDRLTWAFSVENVLREFIGQAGFFELVLDDLSARPGDDMTRLFTQVGATNQFTTLGLLVRLALETRYQRDARVLAAIRQLNAMRQSHAHHRYVAAGQPAVMLDGSDRLAVGQVAGDVSSAYLRDESIERLKPARQERLSQELNRQAILQAGRIASGEDTTAYTQEELARKITSEAIREMGGIREEDKETVDYEESVRLLGVRQITVNGVEQHEVEYVVVYRENGGGWQDVADTRRWYSDSEFEYRLFMYSFSQSGDVVQTASMIVAFGAVALIAWEVGALALLIELGGGPVAVGVSISISTLIYMLTHERWTLEGFIVAGIQGYLAAVGFKVFAPLGGVVGRWVLPASLSEASFLRLTTGWLLSRAAVGGATGLVGGPVALFVEDLARILAHGGGFSSLRSYLVSAAFGFALGIGVELAGSLILAPIFRAGGRTALQTVEEVIAQLRLHRITPAQWIAESTGALSRLRAFLYANLDGDIAQQMQRIFVEKFEQVTANYVSGLRVTVFRQVFELAEIELSRNAVNGLERMLTASASRMSNDALVSLLRNVSRSPERTGVFLSVMHAVDDPLLEQVITSNQLRALSEAESLLGIGATRPATEIAGLLRRFNVSVEATEAYALRLSQLRDDLRSSVLDALRDRGTAVTPASLLRVAESGTPLSPEVLSGLERLVRASQNLPHLEQLLALMPDARVGSFINLARGLSDADLVHLLALADNPTLGASLLSYADSPQLFRIMQASGHNLTDLDALFTRTLQRTGEPGPYLPDPGAVEQMLGRPGNTLASVQNLVNLVDGDIGLLNRTINRLGAQADLERVFNQARLHASTQDAPAMRRFLQTAERHAFNDANDMVEFMRRVQTSQASPARMTLEAATDALDTFALRHSRSTAAPPVLAGHGPNNLATPTSMARLTLSNGSVAEIYFTNQSLQHVQEGHTFEHFWFDPGKIDRSGQSTLYPAGTSNDQLADIAVAAINDTNFLPNLEAAIAAGKRADPKITLNGTEYQIVVETTLPRTVVTCYPLNGPGAYKIQRHVLHGIKAMLKL